MPGYICPALGGRLWGCWCWVDREIWGVLCGWAKALGGDCMDVYTATSGGPVSPALGGLPCWGGGVGVPITRMGDMDEGEG